MFNASKMFFTNRIIELQCLNRFRYFNIVSRTVAPEENCPSPTLKLTLTLNQTLTLTVEQFFSGEIIRIPLIFYDLIISFIHQKTLNSRRHIRDRTKVYAVPKCPHYRFSSKKSRWTFYICWFC